ncbi:MAG: c-type cytochrome, partial [Planctomycetes bacterium]|nr:c-type cytochrome [Planctomycetota bacterium]
VAEKLIRPGEYHLVAVRVYGQGKKKGFHGPAPAVINEIRAISLQGPWQFHIGDNLLWAKPTHDRPKDVAAFNKVQDTTTLPGFNRVLGKGLSAADAAKTFTVPNDLRLDQVVAEPHVKQPVSFHFDERGRLWVMNYLQYPHPAGLKLVSRDMYWRAVYDKVPPPPPNHFRGKDRITIHEDTKGSGLFDKHSVFVDGLNIATASLHGRSGVWVLNPPYLLFYPVKPGAVEPNGDPVVHLSGFGLEDTHSVASSLRWGPDGWMYGAHGSTVTAQIKRPGDKAPIAQMIGQHIWRYHPEKKEFEVFGEGGGNAWGVEIDNLGRVFSGHNGGNTRGFHYIQGAYYRKGFEKHGQLSNPFAFGFFEAMKANDSPRFSHTFTIYEGTTLPEKYRSQLFAVHPLNGQVIRSEIKPDRSSLQTLDLEAVVKSTDSWFRPVDIQHGPDGALYIADFSNPHISHLRHHEGQIVHESGRIYRLTAKDAKPQAAFDLGKKSTAELIELLGHENRWIRETALRLLGDRKDRAVIPILEKLAFESRGPLALHALWGLNLSGGFNEDVAAKTLAHAEPAVRTWTVRLLGDEKKVGPKVATALADLARTEKDLMVRVQLAASARRLPTTGCLSIVRQLLLHDEDAGDIHQPLLLWWAIESKCGSERETVLDMFRDSPLWTTKLVEHTILSRLMKRFAIAGSQKELTACVELFRLAPQKKHGIILLKGFEEAFKGRSIAGLPTELLQEIAKLGGGSLAFGVRLGKADSVDKALTAVQNPKAPPVEREELIVLFGEAKQPACVRVLLDLAARNEPANIRKAALTSLQAYNEDRIGAAVVTLLPKVQGDVREVAESLLTSRKNWSRQLLDAVDDGALKPGDIPTATVKKVLLHRDDRLAELVKKHWGDIKGATTSQMLHEIDRIVAVVGAAPGNPYPGKKLFKDKCMTCHTLHSQGGNVGPDLTPFKRDDLANMVLHIVNPSAEIREGYENSLIVTESGRTLTGVVQEKDAKIVVLRTADGQKLVLPRDDIAEMIVIGVSLMPEGLLDGMTDQQVRDLFAYLRSTQPLNDGTR